MTTFSWFPQTKVRIPTTQSILERPALLAKVVTAARSRRLTLISAPAGAGKTTLALLTVRQLQPLPTAWLTVDRTDNEPSTFLYGLVAAFQTIMPTLGQWVAEAVAGGQTPPEEIARLFGLLINDLTENHPDPLLLVVDDLHLLTDSTVAEGLLYFIERMPPQLHLIATTRYDPSFSLARLRSQGELSQIHLTHLLFSLEESQTLLNDILHLELEAADIAKLHQRSEGWVAGLRLLTLPLSELLPMQRRQMIDRLSNDSRYIFELLADEVLDQQSGEIRQFLLETSILPELTPLLCQAVTLRQDAPDILDDLYRRNLFLMAVPNDEGGLNYRYHALFQDFLRQRLEREQRERIAPLHARAARAALLPTHAFDHFVKGGLWEEAATLLESIGQEALWQSRLATLDAWLALLPATILENNPPLLYLQGQSLYFRGHTPASRTALERALALFEARGDKAGQYRVLSALYDNVLQGFDSTDWEATITRCEQLLAEPIPDEFRVQLLCAMAWWYQMNGDWQAIERTITEAITICRATTELSTLSTAVINLSLFLAFYPNGRRDIVAFQRRYLEQYGEENTLALWSHLGLAWNELWLGNIARTRLALNRLQERVRFMGTIFYFDIELLTANMYSAVIGGDYATYEQAVGKANEMTSKPIAMRLVYMIAAYQAHIAWMRQDSATLKRIFEQRAALLEQGVTNDLMTGVGDILIDAYQQLSEGRWREAERTLLEVAHTQQKLRSPVRVIPDARFILAHLYINQKRRDEACDMLEEGLLFHKEWESVGLLLKDGEYLIPLLHYALKEQIQRLFVEHLLAQWEVARRHRLLALPDSDESLTPREVEVLELLGKGASNREIADHLVVTERTVKSHVTNILGKMGVTSRAQAVVRARELHLL